MPSSRLLPYNAFAVAMLLAASAAPAWAQRHHGQDAQQQDAPPAPPARPSREDETLSDAVRRIERSNRGQVLSAERMQYDGREVNRLKVMDEDGRVRVYMDDPSAGSDPQRRPPPGGGARPPRSRDDDN